MSLFAVDITSLACLSSCNWAAVTMKLKPKTELRFLAAVLLAVACMLTVGAIFIGPIMLKIIHRPWHEAFTSQFYHHHYMSILGIFFAIFVCIAILNAWVAWKLIQYVKRIPDAA